MKASKGVLSFDEALANFKEDYSKFKNSEDEKTIIAETFSGFGDLIVEENNWTTPEGTIVEATRKTFRK